MGVLFSRNNHKTGKDKTIHGPVLVHDVTAFVDPPRINHSPIHNFNISLVLHVAGEKGNCAISLQFHKEKYGRGAERQALIGNNVCFLPRDFEQAQRCSTTSASKLIFLAFRNSACLWEVFSCFFDTEIKCINPHVAFDKTSVSLSL